MSHPFELRLLPTERGRQRLYLVQLPYATNVMPAVDKPTTVANVEGKSLSPVIEHLAQIFASVADAPDPVDLDAGAHSFPASEAEVDLFLLVQKVLAGRGADPKKVVPSLLTKDADEVAFWRKKLEADPKNVALNSLVALVNAGL